MQLRTGFDHQLAFDTQILLGELKLRTDNSRATVLARLHDLEQVDRALRRYIVRIVRQSSGQVPQDEGNLKRDDRAGDGDVHLVRQPNLDAGDGGEALPLRRAAPGDGLRSRVHADHQPHGAGHRQDGARRGGRARRRHRPGAHPGRQVLHGPGWPLLHAGEHAAFRGREPPEARVHPRRGRVPEGLSYEDIQFEVQ